MTADAGPAAAGSVVFEGLNGAQLEAVLGVLERLTLGQITPQAASLIIAMAGVPADKALALVNAMRGAEPPAEDQVSATP